MTRTMIKQLRRRVGVALATIAVGFFAASVVEAAESVAAHHHDGFFVAATHVVKGWGSCSKCPCRSFMGHGDFCDNCGHRFSWH
jgi:hypothetical protein